MGDYLPPPHLNALPDAYRGRKVDTSRIRADIMLNIYGYISGGSSYRRGGASRPPAPLHQKFGAPWTKITNYTHKLLPSENCQQ